jgi:threonyl-tRNA synthetase
VITPNLFNIDLWKTSGHYKNYKENLFLIKNEGKLDNDSQCCIHSETLGLKPMNCPAHCLMFKHKNYSYRELPIRFADFGVLHRNEVSGALSGLTRVRRFQQDDAHIFCRPD